MSEDPEQRKRLIALIRRIAREEAWQAIDQHSEDYEHKQKPADEVDLQ